MQSGHAASDPCAWWIFYDEKRYKARRSEAAKVDKKTELRRGMTAPEVLLDSLGKAAGDSLAKVTLKSACLRMNCCASGPLLAACV